MSLKMAEDGEIMKDGFFNHLSAADVKMEITVLGRSLKASILSSTSFRMGKTFW